MDELGHSPACMLHALVVYAPPHNFKGEVGGDLRTYDEVSLNDEKACTRLAQRAARAHETRDTLQGQGHTHTHTHTP